MPFCRKMFQETKTKLSSDAEETVQTNSTHIPFFQEPKGYFFIFIYLFLVKAVPQFLPLRSSHAKFESKNQKQREKETQRRNKTEKKLKKESKKNKEEKE